MCYHTNLNWLLCPEYPPINKYNIWKTLKIQPKINSHTVLLLSNDKTHNGPSLTVCASANPPYIKKERKILSGFNKETE